MKKLAVLGMGVCIALAFSSCKSSESAYKKAYERQNSRNWLSRKQLPLQKRWLQWLPLQ